MCSWKDGGSCSPHTSPRLWKEENTHPEDIQRPVQFNPLYMYNGEQPFERYRFRRPTTFSSLISSATNLRISLSVPTNSHLLIYLWYFFSSFPLGLFTFSFPFSHILSAKQHPPCVSAMWQNYGVDSQSASSHSQQAKDHLTWKVHAMLL